MAVKQKFKEYRVLSLPTVGLNAGDRYYLNVGANKYQTYIVSDSLSLIKEAGAEFIEKDTMAEMRALSSREIWALQNGYYKGVKLNGYYAKGDTPSPIEYILSTTSTTDDGGSVIEVGGVKLEHDFKFDIDMSYFGLKNEDVINSKIMKVLNYTSVKNLWCIVPSGKYFVDKGFIPPFNSRIKGMGRNATSLVINPLTAIDDNPPFLEHYVINAHNSGLWLTDIELDCNAPNITTSRSSGINATNNITNVLLERIRIKNAKVKTPGYSGGYGITSWGNASNVTINDIEFENIGQSDLGIFEGSNWYITNVKSKNCGYMVVNIESSTGSTTIKDIVVDGVFASEVGHSVISLIKNNATTGQVESCIVKNVFVDKCSKTETHVGSIRVRATKNCRIENVTIGESMGSGLVISGDQDFPCEGLIVNNLNINKITASTFGYGVSITATSPGIRHKNLTLNNVYIGNSREAGCLADKVDGLSIKDMIIGDVSNSRGFQVQNCSNVNGYNIQVRKAYSYGSVIQDSKDVNIINCQSLDCAGAGFYIAGTSDNVKIDTSTVLDTRVPKTLVNAITIESTLPDKSPNIIISNNNLKNVLATNKIGIQAGVLRDNIKILNNIGVSDASSTTVKGLVNQTAALANISQADLVATTSPVAAVDTASSATDVAGLVTDFNDLVGKYNVAVALLNELKTKYDLNVTLTNAIKTSQNTELTNQRTAGQQSTT